MADIGPCSKPEEHGFQASPPGKPVNCDNADHRCLICRGTGWVTSVDYDGSGYETACGCMGAAPLEPDETDTEAAMIPEVPF